MDREHPILVELDVASIATKGPPGEAEDEFGGQAMFGLNHD